MPKPFLLDDPERAHVLLRCTQEIITNAVRHAQAQILRLRYAWDGAAIRLQARDDGRGTENPNAGNGLAGLRSEGHTSALPYLMRNSAAVTCLKKQTQQDNAAL